jgi:hypothetical protein
MTPAKSKKPSYLLRGLDPVLWKRFQDRATKDLRPMRSIILRLVELYTRHGLETIELMLEDQRDRDTH